jgi:hypothetical protein
MRTHWTCSVNLSVSVLQSVLLRIYVLPAICLCVRTCTHLTQFLQNCNLGKLLTCAALSNQDGVVSIATHYRLDGLGIESQWEWDFLHMSTCSETSLASCPVSTRPLLVAEWQWPHADHPHPTPSARLWKGWSCTSAFSLCLHRHVMGWPLPLPPILKVRYEVYMLGNRMQAFKIDSLLFCCFEVLIFVTVDC